MILFHGTNNDIESINLSAGQKHKDFGQGFYLTPDKNTAERMARKKASLFGGTPMIIVYEFDRKSAENSNVKIKIFPEIATPDWLRFIDQNRNNRESIPSHNYDIVIGPIADDGVVVQLTNFRNHLLTPEEAAKNLQDRFLDQQYFFGSIDALAFLKKVDVWKII